MKTSLIRTACCLIAVLFFSIAIPAQQTVQGLKQKLDFTVDGLGNANIEVTMKLNAAQWEGFKRTMGNNTSIIKRELEKSLPKFYLTDFNYSEDQMERSYTVKMKALGMCMINRKGNWEAKLDMKNPDITKLADREFLMNQDMMSSGLLIQQTLKIHLPSGASDSKVEKDSFGNAVLTYSTGMGWGHKLVNYGGIVLIAAGTGIFMRRVKSKKA
jgi:hypothetical protein